MKQAARRFRVSQFPDLGKQDSIKVAFNFKELYMISFFYKDLIINPLWFELRAGSNETLLLFDNGVGRESEMEGNRILVFGSKVHLHLLLRSLDMMGDGTFDVCPYIGKEKFYQLVRAYMNIGKLKDSYFKFQYTLAGFVRNTPFTLLCVLMQKKDAKSYKELFNFML